MIYLNIQKNEYNGEKLGENLSKYGGDHSGISQGEIPTNMWYGKKFYYTLIILHINMMLNHLHKLFGKIH